jgi:hypothetical protein
MNNAKKQMKAYEEKRNLEFKKFELNRQARLSKLFNSKVAAIADFKTNETSELSKDGNMKPRRKLHLLVKDRFIEWGSYSTIHGNEN